MQVTIDIPDQIGEELAARNAADLPRAVLEMVSIEGYRSERLTHAEVGRLLGLDHPLQVEAFLKEHDVPLQYTLEDLEQDRETHRKLGL
jgi:predicted HTH domain antitoxin